MKITGRFVVSEIYVGTKGSTYYTLVDLSDVGGQVKLSVKDGEFKVLRGEIIEGEMVVKGSYGQYGQTLYLKGVTLNKPK